MILSKFKNAIFDKLQHEMYWNLSQISRLQKFLLINYNMRCIETLMSNPMMKNTMQINYNMRCIETKGRNLYALKITR